MESFEQLMVWQKAHALVFEVYRATARFPGDEKFGLVSQMRRAAVSVPANIAEGWKRSGPNDKARFYNIAQASLEELRYYFILCRDLNFIEDFAARHAQTDEIARMLFALTRNTRG
jgi:four helix bundle protein